MPDPELLLVRHGRSAHVETGWVDVDGVRQWMAAYDAAEIMPEHAPPAELEALVRDASRVIASDLPRTVASAVRLAPEREIVRTPLLREAPMVVGIDRTSKPYDDFQTWCREIVWWGNKKGAYLYSPTAAVITRELAGHY